MDISEVEKQFKKLESNYENTLDESLASVVLDGKKLKDALKEQLSLQMEWEYMLAKAKSIKEMCDTIKEEAHSAAVTNELKDSYRDTSVTEAKIFANGDKDYKAARRLGIKINNLHDDIKSAHEVITSRKYVLNNLTNATIASVENSIL